MPLYAPSHVRQRAAYVVDVGGDVGMGFGKPSESGVDAGRSSYNVLDFVDESGHLCAGGGEHAQERPLLHRPLRCDSKLVQRFGERVGIPQVRVTASDRRAQPPSRVGRLHKAVPHAYLIGEHRLVSCPTQRTFALVLHAGREPESRAHAREQIDAHANRTLHGVKLTARQEALAIDRRLEDSEAPRCVSSTAPT